MEFNRAIDKAVVELVEEYLLPHTCQLFTKEIEFRPFASGIFFFLGKNYYILTAAHVTEGMTASKQLYIRIPSGYISAIGSLKETNLSIDEKTDLAFIQLDNEILEPLLKSRKFLTIDKIRGKHKLQNSTQYCILGFPTKNLKKVDGLIRTGASFFLVQPCNDKVYKQYKFDANRFYLMEFKGKGTNIISGRREKISPDHYGLSGCGLWLILLTSDGEKFKTDYRLIGIVTEFRKGKYYCLISNKIDILLEELIEIENIKLRLINPS